MQERRVPEKGATVIKHAQVWHSEGDKRPQESEPTNNVVLNTQFCNPITAVIACSFQYELRKNPNLHKGFYGIVSQAEQRKMIYQIDP